MRRPRTTAPIPYTTLFRSRMAASASREGDRPCPRNARSLSVTRPARSGRGAASPSSDKLRAFLGHGLRSEEHTSELQSRENLVCRLLLEKKNYSVLAKLRK